MTLAQSHILETGEFAAIRARIRLDASGKPVVELTQLRRRPDGFEAETARVSVPVDAIDELTSTLVALRSSSQLEQTPRERRLRVKPPRADDHNEMLRRYRTEGEF